MFQDNVSVPSSRVEKSWTSWPLKMGLKTLVRNYHSTLCKIPCRSSLHSGGSLKFLKSVCMHECEVNFSHFMSYEHKIQQDESDSTIWYFVGVPEPFCMVITAVWDVMPCNLGDRCQCFGGMCCFHRQHRRIPP
jgi:hypothetical protein